MSKFISHTTLIKRGKPVAHLIGDFGEDFGCMDYDKGTFFVAQNPQPTRRRALLPIEDSTCCHERNQLGSGY
jgi:hypothetical protein